MVAGESSGAQGGRGLAAARDGAVAIPDDYNGSSPRKIRQTLSHGFAIIFFWTPPHFWALSLYRTGDYAAAGVPMLGVVSGPRETKRQILLYTLVPRPASVAPWLLGVADTFYGAGALLLSALFTGMAIRVWRDDSDRSARRMFAFSLLYLFLNFSLLLVDHAGVNWH